MYWFKFKPINYVFLFYTRKAFDIFPHAHHLQRSSFFLCRCIFPSGIIFPSVSRASQNISYGAGLLVINFFHFVNSILPLFLDKFSLDMEFQINGFGLIIVVTFCTIKIVVPLSSDLNSFQWEVCCHSYLYSLVYHVSFSSTAFQIFSLSLILSNSIIIKL